MHQGHSRRVSLSMLIEEASARIEIMLVAIREICLPAARKQSTKWLRLCSSRMSRFSTAETNFGLRKGGFLADRSAYGAKMRQKKSVPSKQLAEGMIRDIRRATRRHFSAEEKIRIVLQGLRGEESIADLCRLEGIASSMYYGWSKEFLEAGKKRLDQKNIASVSCAWLGPCALSD
jgi:transposase-like protein